jgi:HlyD family secretion protein
MFRSKIRVVLLRAFVLFAVVAVFASVAFLRMDAQELPKAVQGKKADATRSILQPATIQAFESVRVFASVSGFLNKQTVDIGDRVKRGQVLATVDASDLEAQLRHDTAVVHQARSLLKQAKARLGGAEADAELAKLAVHHAEASVQLAAATVRYRLKQFNRMEELAKNKAIEINLLDEFKERYEAAVGAEQSATSAVAAARARTLAGTSKVELAKAELETADAGVMIAQANLENTQVQLSHATVLAPFDGVITQRGYSPGEFIRSADKRNNDAPLFTVQRMDLMRAIVSIAERDVPFVHIGDAAEMEFDALPGKKWTAKISRVAAALDSKTASMRVEIDLPNPSGLIYPGMHGKAALSFPVP